METIETDYWVFEKIMKKLLKTQGRKLICETVQHETRFVNSTSSFIYTVSVQIGLRKKVSALHHFDFNPDDEATSQQKTNKKH